MKKIKALLTLGLALGVLGGAASAFAYSKESSEANATSLETYIPMEPSFFTNWTDAAGEFASKDAKFWDEGYSFEALDTFYRGETGETWTGTLTSRTWKQSTQYIYFQLGGAKDFDVVGDPVHLKIYYGDYFAVFYNNTFMENPMTLRYFKVPDAAYKYLKTQGETFDMHIEIIDAQTAGYGFANFGYLHVNQTLESTSDAMRYFLNHLSTDSREWEVNKRKDIFNSYFDNEAQREVFFATADGVDDSFSSNESFVKHWYFDHNFFNNEYGPERHFDQAISTNEYRPDAATNMPFNNDEGFFRGWYEDAEGHKSGFVASDALRYRFISRPFYLDGTGIVSIKMAGKASLHVIDATVKNTDNQAADLAWIDNHALEMSGDQTNMAKSGFNTTAMVNHVINLEQYVGRKIQLAICDYDTSDWSACYFDELVTYYEDSPIFHVDVAKQENTSGTYYPLYTDIYVNSGKLTNENALGIKYKEDNPANTSEVLAHEDASDAYGAHKVWKSYLDVVRGEKLGSNYCSILTSDEVKAVLNAYKALPNSAKQVVCDSDDFERVGSGEYYEIEPTIYDAKHSYNLGRSIQYLASENGINVLVYSNGLSLGHEVIINDPTLVIVVGSLVVLAGIVLVIIKLKKRKQIK